MCNSFYDGAFKLTYSHVDLVFVQKFKYTAADREKVLDVFTNSRGHLQKHCVVFRENLHISVAKNTTELFN